MKGANANYWGNIIESFSSLWAGLKLSMRHLWDARFQRNAVGVDSPDYFLQDKGVVTLQYPYETLPLPDNSRYRLHNEIDDCIVCDKCAKICPVDCIDIEPIRSPEEIGKTSDGTPKRLHAAKFDIDMAKCCFCGLCTTVCPTECLTMTKAYDFSEFDVKEHNYSFAEMTPLEIIEAQQKLAQATKEKEEKAARQAEQPTSTVTGTTRPKIAVRAMPPKKAPSQDKSGTEDTEKEASATTPEKTDNEQKKSPDEAPKPKMVMRSRPTIKKKKDGDE